MMMTMIMMMVIMVILMMMMMIWKFDYHIFSTVLRLSLDWPVVSGGGSRSTQQKPPSHPMSLTTFSHAPGPGFEAKQWRHTANSQWQRKSPVSHQGRS